MRFVAAVVWLSLVACGGLSQTTTVVEVGGLSDTRLRQISETTNYGSATYVDAGASQSGQGVRTLLRWTGLSSGTLVPPNMELVDATLSLFWYFESAPRTQDTALQVFRAAREWTEAGATWSSRDGVTAWANAGGDWFDSRGMEQGGVYSFDEVVVRTTDSVALGYLELDVTGIVRGVLNRTWGNLGFMVKAKAEGGNYIAFYSREKGTSPPKLTLTLRPRSDVSSSSSSPVANRSSSSSTTCECALKEYPCCDGCHFKPHSTVCRASTDVSCDPQETCTGSSSQCPPDVINCLAKSSSSNSSSLSSSVECVCSSGSGPCCDGCHLRPASVVCRESSSWCDPAEGCSGQSAECPQDVNTCTAYELAVWHLDEGKGTYLADSTTTQLNGRLSSGFKEKDQWVAAGLSGSALAFLGGGGGGIMEVPDPDVKLTPDRDKFASLGGTESVLFDNGLFKLFNRGEGTSPNSLHWLVTLGDSNVAIGDSVWKGKAGILTVTSFRQNRWYHVVAERSGDVMAVWVNGKLDRKMTCLDVYSPASNVASDLVLGKFAGTVDEVAVFNGALTQAQISAEFAKYGARAEKDDVVSSAPGLFARLISLHLISGLWIGMALR